MRKRSLIVCVFLTALPAAGQVWKPLGPPGGDVRALTADPARPVRIFLARRMATSSDRRIPAAVNRPFSVVASSRADAVITAIVVDPRDGNVLYASSWARNSSTGGGVFRSADGGHTWTAAGLAGQSVRTLVMAPSDPNLLIAGTLDGVYRSMDASRTWERISPEHHAELRNLDSLAIDPRDPQTIYAGTFHLPWKTVDGGRSWHPIQKEMTSIDSGRHEFPLIAMQRAMRGEFTPAPAPEFIAVTTTRSNGKRSRASRIVGAA